MDYLNLPFEILRHPGAFEAGFPRVPGLVCVKPDHLVAASAANWPSRVSFVTGGGRMSEGNGAVIIAMELSVYSDL